MSPQKKTQDCLTAKKDYKAGGQIILEDSEF